MARRLFNQETGASLPSTPKRRRRRRPAFITASQSEGQVTPGARRRALRQRRKRQHQNQKRQTNSHFWLWSFLWVSLVILLGSLGSIGFFLLTRVPPSPDCTVISPLSTPAERLYCAKQMARSGEIDGLVAAVAVVKPWPPDHPLYPEGQRLLAEWSEEILTIARQVFQQGNLEKAITTARQIPESSPLYPQVETTIASWLQHWERGRDVYNQVQIAIKQQNWEAARQQVQLLSQVKNPHWQQQLAQVKQQIDAERSVWQRLGRAEELAETKTVEKLREAIGLAKQIGRKSYGHPKARAKIAHWSRELLKIAENRLAQKNVEGAIAAAKPIPADSPLGPEAQDFIQLSRAQEAAWEGNILSLAEAQMLARKLSPNSPLYQASQQLLQESELDLRDRAQLRLARSTASFGQIATFQLAIAQAQTIALNNPQRLQAQTLIAQWRKDIQRLEDRPYLRRARQRAEPATLENLKAAIAEASQVALGRPLRIEAQTLIAQWNKQIEIIEDRPFLIEARDFAKRGNLTAAIRIAQQIRPGRALHAEAQSDINDWNRQLEIAADRPILEAARALASQVRLTQAIRKASTIAPGRALYPEAQAAIAVWRRERAEILARRAAEARKAEARDDETTTENDED